MDDGIDPAELARLKKRTTWTGSSAQAGGRARAECAAARAGHLAVELGPDEVPHCAHCGETLSPEALRRAGITSRRA